MTAPRGLRNNNPGNIRHGEKWQGMAVNQTDPEFVQFESLTWGIRALVVLLQTYRRKHRLTTVRGIITRWAPPSENDTEAYIRAVCDGWVRPDEELPDERNTYLFLAQRIARHENGPEASRITKLAWDKGLDLVFDPAAVPAQPQPVGAPKPAPVTPAPAPVTPTPAPARKVTMPLPAILYAAASTLLPVVVDLFRAHGSQTAERNADILSKAGPALVEIAKEVTGAPTEQQAVEAVMADPEMQQEFRKAVELDVDRLVGMIERVTKAEDDSRDRAAARVRDEVLDIGPRMADQQFWVVAAVGVGIAIVAGIDMWKDGAMSEGVLAILASYVGWAMQKRSSIVDYRFGSSAGSAAKDVIIADNSKR